MEWQEQGKSYSVVASYKNASLMSVEFPNAQGIPAVSGRSTDFRIPASAPLPNPIASDRCLYRATISTDLSRPDELCRTVCSCMICLKRGLDSDVRHVRRLRYTSQEADKGIREFFEGGGNHTRPPFSPREVISVVGEIY